MQGVKSLSQEEIRQRLIRLNNLERLYPIARSRIDALEKENKQLKQRIDELEDKNKDQNTKIEALSFQFEQIKNKLFGTKPFLNRIIQKKEKKIRDTFSYCRPIPTAITKKELHPVHECARCHGKLKDRSIRVFFEEDIPLAHTENSRSTRCRNRILQQLQETIIRHSHTFQEVGTGR